VVSCLLRGAWYSPYKATRVSFSSMDVLFMFDSFYTTSQHPFERSRGCALLRQKNEKKIK